MENAKIHKLKYDILSNFQTMQCAYVENTWIEKDKENARKKRDCIETSV